MYVCICNGVTDRQIRECAAAGVRCMDELQMELGVATQCGRCRATAREILEDAAGPFPEPLAQAA